MAATNHDGDITTTAANSLPRLPNELWYEILSHVNARDLWLNARYTSQGLKDNVEHFWRLIVLPCIEIWVSYEYEIVASSEASSSAGTTNMCYDDKSNPAIAKGNRWLSSLNTGNAHLNSFVLWLALKGGSDVDKVKVGKEERLALSLEGVFSEGSDDGSSFDATIVHCCVLFHGGRRLPGSSDTV